MVDQQLQSYKGKTEKNNIFFYLLEISNMITLLMLINLYAQSVVR